MGVPIGLAHFLYLYRYNNNNNNQTHIDMKKTILIAAAAMTLIGCRAGGNSFYGSPEPLRCGTDDAVVLTDTIEVEVDGTRDEYGNCKKSPYTKFYEEWEER